MLSAVVVKNVKLLPSKHGTITQCCFNVGPASKTVGQNWNSIGLMPRVSHIPASTKTLNQCWISVDPASWTMGQHWSNIKSMYCVYWGTIFSDLNNFHVLAVSLWITLACLVDKRDITWTVEHVQGVKYSVKINIKYVINMIKVWL